MVVKFVIASVKQLRERPGGDMDVRFVVRFRGQECPRHTSKSQAEKDVPQPHDFVAWGFTKTNPCCISVS